MDDYTNKYKGEQIEVALFGGEYQEGVLTAYCSIEDVPHIELNGHILVPLQNVASLHCSSRCDAPEPDWPPRGLGDDDATATASATTTAAPAAVNIAKWWLLAAMLAALGARSAGRSAAPRPRRCSSSARCSPRSPSTPTPTGRCSGCSARASTRSPRIPLLRSTVDALAAKFAVVPPKLYLIPDGYPRASPPAAGPAGSALALSTGLLGALTPAELEAVIAHELAHVRRRDVLTQTSAVMLAVVLVDLSRIGGWFERALLAVLGPIAAAFVHLLSPRRELAADRMARGSCGSGDGARRRAAQARPGERPRLVPGEPGDRAALHRQPVRRGGPRRALRHASAAARRLEALRELAG